MTTASKTKNVINKRTAGRNSLPPSAEVLNLSGNDYLIVSLNDFEEWFDDMLLMAVADERLQNKPLETIPMEEVFARQDAKRRKGK